MHLADISRQHAAERPDAVALTAGTASLTFGELDERACRVAQALLAAGVVPGDRIAFLDKNGPEYFELLFGATKVGAVVVAVNWRLAPTEMAFIVDDARAPLLVVGGEYAPLVPDLQGSHVREVVVLGEAYAAWRDAHEAVDPQHPSAGDEVVLQLYTSGTTGLPKGAMITNDNFFALATVADLWHLDDTSVSLVAMPLFHIGGSGWALVSMLNGGRLVVVREFLPGPVLDLLVEERVTNAFLVPAVLQFLCMVPGAADRDFSSLRSLVYGASPITDTALLASMRTFGCDHVQVYGLTETTGAITQLDAADHDPDGPRAHLLRSAGRAYPWLELRVVGLDGAVAPAGAVGEVQVRGAQVMAGYWQRPDDAPVDADGWFRSGDGGYLDDEGFLFLTDRLKDMIVSGGENVYPVEIENVLAGHPGVAEVAVIGVPDETWGETVKAVVVRAGEVDEDSLLAYARERLAGFKVPRSVDWVEVLPRNPSGKVLKRQLREPYWAGRDRQVN